MALTGGNTPENGRCAFPRSHGLSGNTIARGPKPAWPIGPMRQWQKPDQETKGSERGSVSHGKFSLGDGGAVIAARAGAFKKVCRLA